MVVVIGITKTQRHLLMGEAVRRSSQCQVDGCASHSCDRLDAIGVFREIGGEGLFGDASESRIGDPLRARFETNKMSCFTSSCRREKCLRRRLVLNPLRVVDHLEHRRDWCGYHDCGGGASYYVRVVFNFDPAIE